MRRLAALAVLTTGLLPIVGCGATLRTSGARFALAPAVRLDAPRVEPIELEPLEPLAVDHVAALSTELDAQFIVPRATTAAAGAGTNPIAAARLPGGSATLPQHSWSVAGAGTIPTSRARCTTGTGTSVLATSSTAAQINTAIGGCDANHAVELASGTFNLTAGIDFNGNSNVTLRGQGPFSTLLVFADGSEAACGGIRGAVCFRSDFLNTIDSPGTTASWTAGYAQGATQLTFSTVSGLSTGMAVVLDQLNDSDTDTGEVWVCEHDNICSDEGGQAARSGRAQTQIVKVTAINGNVVTVTPGLYMPNWRTGQTPQAWWAGGPPISGSGIEDLKIDMTAFGPTCASTPSNVRGGVTFYNAYGNWVKHVFIRQACRATVIFFQSAHNTVQDSYFYDSHSHVQQSYGFEWSIGHDNLVLNNIMHKISAPFQNNGGYGNVVAYNYTFNDEYLNPADASQMQQSNYHHAAGVGEQLEEGNEGTGFAADGVHGTQHFLTGLRNYWHGWEQSSQTSNTNAVAMAAFNRYNNLLCNVLGTNSYHTAYATGSATSIYHLDYSPGSPVLSDSKVSSTLLRWGNYDTVNDAAQWSSGEVPTGDAFYPNSVPASQTCPNSLIYSAAPAWWGSVPWPAIGPDVTTGVDVSTHVAKIPARLCYDTSTKSGAVLTAFDGTGCP